MGDSCVAAAVVSTIGRGLLLIAIYHIIMDEDSLLRCSITRFPTKLSPRVGGARLDPGDCDVVSCARLLWKGNS
jgi:hypothetical protein